MQLFCGDCRVGSGQTERKQVPVRSVCIGVEAINIL